MTEALFLPQKISSLEILTVSQFAQLLKRHVEPAFSSVCLQGELSGYTRHSSGHHYFSLKDENSLVECVCWRAVASSMGECFKEGAHVVCTGRVSIYPARSRYQLVVESMRFQGEGSLLQQIEARKKALTEEGVFSGPKKPLPLFPQYIGIITSPTGSVIQDMLHRFHHRMPCTLFLYPVSVQGKTAPSEIIEGIHHFIHASPQPDILIIARGGGSIEDLWPFHDEALVRAVAKCPIPVISAIGHETDTTLIDYAADVRAPTPTAAVELAVRVRQEVLDDIRGIFRRFHSFFSQHMALHFLHFQRLCEKFFHHQEWWHMKAQRLDEIDYMMQRGALSLLKNHAHRLAVAVAQLRPLKEVSFYEEKIRGLFEKMHSTFQNFLEKRALRLESYGRLLHGMSFKRTLERGFVLVTENEDGSHILSSVEKASRASTLYLRFADGCIATHPSSPRKEKCGS